MTSKKILSEERNEQVMAAVEEWFLALPGVKTRACEALGFKISIVHGWRTGLRSPPPSAMKILYKETQDKRFLLTAEEKEKYSRGNKSEVPNEDGWPNLPEGEVVYLPAGSKVVTRDNPEEKVIVVELMRKLVNEINRISKLPAGNPEREKARRELVGPAMRLFTATTMLDIEFPEAFEDLRRQLELSQKL